MRALLALAMCLAAPTLLAAQTVGMVPLDLHPFVLRFANASPVTDVVAFRAPSAGSLPRARYRRCARGVGVARADGVGG